MSKRSSGEIRAEVIARMRIGFREGQKVGAFIKEMQAQNLSYRRTTMLADWRSINQLESKKELFKYVRKNYTATAKSIAQVEWELSEEFMYKVRVSSRLSPGEPLTERFVNIMSDKPLTPGQVETEVLDKWSKWEKYGKEIIESIVPVTAVQRKL